MNRDQTLDTFFSLLRSGLWEQKDRALTETPDWDAVLSLAKEQTVTGIICRGTSYLPETLMPPSLKRIALMVDTNRIAQRSEKVEATADKLVGMFKDAGLNPIILKGPEAARHYPAPSYRASGDIDIFFDSKDYSSALSLIASKGAKTKRESDGSDVYVWDDVTVEHHPRYFDVHVKAESLPPVPSPEAELLMLSSHILKHTIGVGVGLRQVCDIAEAYVALDREYDHAHLAAVFRGAGLGRWNNILCSLLVGKIGVSPSVLPAFDTVSYRKLLSIILIGGNFGQRKGNRKSGKRSSGGKFRTAIAFLLRLPFSLRIAPKETMQVIIELTSGNLG